MTGRLITLCFGFATLARAQTISGRVTDRTSGVPVAGVVVSAVDARGEPLIRAVTDSATGYRITLVGGAVRLHFRRIGFSPAQVALSDTLNGRIDVVLTRLPTQLPPVKAVASAQCDADANPADALSLWEEARSALITSLVARETKTAFMSVLVYQTNFVGDDEQPRMVQRKEMADVSHAFQSDDPKFLARKGYFDRFAFIGPDENVLADDSFLSTHCFRMGESPNDSTIALRFSPAKGRKVVDLEGTILFKRDPLDIRSIEYRYTGTPSNIERGRPGGSIHFRNMPNGITMVQEWRVRSAWQERGASRARAPIARRASRAPVGGTITGDPTLNVSETGALIELMQWADGAPFVASLATVSGVAIDKLTNKPLPFTPVRLFRTPYTATTDSTGAFTMIDVLPGIYQADVGDPRLDLYGAAGDLVGPFAVKFGANTGWRLTGDGPEASALRGCAEKADGRVDMPRPLAGTNVIFGMITTASGDLPPRGQEFRVEVMPAGAVAGTPPFPLKGKADQYGLFRICGLPAGSVSIRSSTKTGLSTILDVAIDPSQPYHLLTLKLPIMTGR
jgi:hypothetical protein